MKYIGNWTYAFREITQGTTFDNVLTITESGDTVLSSAFEGGYMLLGQVLYSPSITAAMTASTTGGEWAVKTQIDSTIDPCEYMYYSVTMFNGNDEYEVKNGLVYVKSKFGGE